MIHFKDQTFCASSIECANTKCFRNLTPKLAKQGEKWWGSKDFPVCYSDFKVGCDDYQEKNTSQEGMAVGKKRQNSKKG